MMVILLKMLGVGCGALRAAGRFLCGMLSTREGVAKSGGDVVMLSERVGSRRHVPIAGRLARPAMLPAAVLLALGACSPAGTQENAVAPVGNTTAESVPAPTPPVEARGEAAVVAKPATAGPAKVIGLEGLSSLRIGEAVPAGARWAERGAQIDAACRTVNSSDYPGVYAIVTEGKVRRITVGQRSDVKLVEGIGVGASEAEVKKWFAGFRETPHKYEAAPAKYLTAPNVGPGEPGVRFEIGQDGKVRLIHVGTMPVLGYVEGCG